MHYLRDHIPSSDIDHVEKTFRVIQRQRNLPAERWVETTTWFFHLGVESWWAQDSRPLSAQDAMNWDVFRHLFEARFTPLKYKDPKKNEFTELKQGKMSVTEYHRKFTDLSRYSPEIVGNPREMFCYFKKGTRKRLRSLATSTPFSTYQEFFDILLHVEDSDNAPDDDDDDDEDNNNDQKNNNRGQSSFGPQKT
ncbi:hypothetical protein ACFX15_000045 [Malus domestica]